MAGSTHQPPTVHTATPDAVAPEFNHTANALNRPDIHSPMDDISDCESVASADHSGTALSPFTGAGLMKLGEGDEAHRFINQRLVSRLSALGVQATVAEIHRNCSSSAWARARAEAFQVYLRAAQKKGGSGTANVRYAWYATSKEEVCKIISYGFVYDGKPKNSGLYGCGVYFAPDGHPLECLESAPADEDGLRHLLLCRVILGKSELVSFGSEQSHPSSEQYDSGVDDLSSPRRYIVWSTHVNTHVLAEYVVSFGAPCRSRGLSTTLEESWQPTSPWMPVRVLIFELSKILRPSEVNLISKYFKQHSGGKISRHLLVQRVRQIAGDGLLTRIIKSFGTKQSGA
ncbi:probable inactive poly [ADP-ribose] polymerase SRO5 [Rhodamnia argentea]|uniref:Probable inactive poly [ADP-ribose] polymerase SRO5 n=1 Tax=Rhodamnia argentea TaxID=178133 RepID=A0A8B8P8R9_9MYRT|nr:probable inactive poly [ADP-ribose] polymerase SRO5 [Rhodamnia argentea]XP_030531240.1 probable inactive poly [ADP-ribose] polymerase SRO5 [Rhodamnia argentea]XP_048135872.1 probable inactive poly [ADP-ribose] polymerase SRO5 [Rhodamnia argentea]